MFARPPRPHRRPPRQGGELIAVGIEGAGGLGAPLAHALDAAGEEVVEVPARLTARERRRLRRLGKSDSADALAIARVVVSEQDLPAAIHARGPASAVPRRTSSGTPAMTASSSIQLRVAPMAGGAGSHRARLRPVGLTGLDGPRRGHEATRGGALFMIVAGRRPPSPVILLLSAELTSLVVLEGAIGRSNV